MVDSIILVSEPFTDPGMVSTKMETRMQSWEDSSAELSKKQLETEAKLESLEERLGQKIDAKFEL